MEPHGEETPHVPPPTLWPVGFAVGIARPARRPRRQPALGRPGRRRDRDRLRVPLGPRPDARRARAAARGRARGPRAGRHRARAAGAGGRPRAAAGRARRDLPAQQVPRGRDPRPRRRHRRRHHPAGARLRGRARVPRSRATPTSTSGRSRTSPRASSSSPPSWRTRPRARSAAAPPTCATTAPSQNVAELHDPLQPLRAPRLPRAAERAAVRPTRRRRSRRRPATVRLIPTLPAGFGCPCHGGQYDTEGNRTAGPPVRALDRYEFLIKNGNLLLGTTYSVGKVDRRRRERADHALQAHRPRPARRRPGVALLPDPAAPVMATTTRRGKSTQPRPARGGDQPPARLARGALGPHRRRPLLPLPQGPRPTRTGCRRSARRR